MATRGRKPGTPKTGGRAPGTPNRVTSEIKELARTYGPDAIDTLADIMKDKEHDPRARVAAAKELLDRGYGRASQAVELAGKDGGPISFTPPVIQIVQYPEDDADTAN